MTGSGDPARWPDDGGVRLNPATGMYDPLVQLVIASTTKLPEGSTDDKGRTVTARLNMRVICRLCGDVTRRESGGMVNDAPIQQAGLYQLRHLAKHLTALALEIREATR